MVAAGARRLKTAFGLGPRAAMRVGAAASAWAIRAGAGLRVTASAPANARRAETRAGATRQRAPPYHARSTEDPGP